MNEVNSKKIIGYSKSAVKGAAIGTAIGSTFIIKELIDIRKFSKLIKKYPPSDCFEQLGKAGVVSFSKENAENIGKVLEEGIKNSNTMKDVIKLYNSVSKQGLNTSAKLCACFAGLAACAGIIVHYFKSKANENQTQK